jgi:site-specific recombinase XerD
MILRSFLKYAGETDCAFVAFGMDVATVPTRKTKGRQVEFLSEPALKALLSQPDVYTQTGHRNQFFMILMYDVAARCGELLNLTLRNLRYDEPRPVVFLHGKGNKTRPVPLLPETVAHCRQYIRKFHGDNPQDKDALVFYTKNHGANTQMSADTVALFMKKYSSQVRKARTDFTGNLHPHMLRHTRAMHLYRQGMPVHLLSEFLGHVNFETTKIYAHADTEMKRAAVAKADIVRKGMPSAEPLWVDDEDLILKLSGLR